MVGLQGLVVTSIACGGACSAAITADGELYTWGSSTWQQARATARNRARVRANLSVRVRVGLVQRTLPYP